MSGYIYKIYCEDMNYYGLTRRNIYKRMAQHIEQFENYKEDKKNKCCASAKIFETYGVENVKIELVEHLNDVTDKELLERESYYINNFPCVNIRSKHLLHKSTRKNYVKIEMRDKKYDKYMNKLINMLRSPITNNYYTKEQLLNNFKTVYDQNELYIYMVLLNLNLMRLLQQNSY